MTNEELIGLTIGSYAIAIVIVLMAGVVPTRWQTWTTVHCVALAMPLCAVVSSVLVAIPGLIVLVIIMAAAAGSGPRPRR